MGLDNTIYRWKGSQANPFEILRATQLATSIRDNETGGRARIREINEGGFVPNEVVDVLGPVPSKFKAATCDEVPIKAALYHVSSDTGELIDHVGDTPNLKKNMLISGDCFTLDAGHEGNIFVWKGKEASPDEKHGALQNAEEFITKHGYCPENTKITVFPENSETIVFKDFFNNW